MVLVGILGLNIICFLLCNGFFQVIVIFIDQIDIYFVCQQVVEWMWEVVGDLFEGVFFMFFLVIIGLGEVFMWMVDFKLFDFKKLVKFGQVGW